MSKSKKIVIGVMVVVALFLGLGLLRWSSMVYWRSGGQRGFSPGAAAYQMMGWGAENYMADLGLQAGENGWTTPVDVQLIDTNNDGESDRGIVAAPVGLAFHNRFAGRAIALDEVQLVDYNGDGVPDRGVINTTVQSRYSKFGPYGFNRGFGRSHGGPGCFFLLLVLAAIGGIYLYRRRRGATSAMA